MTDKESINEHIRNGLMPFVNLMSLLRSTNKNGKKELLNSTLKVCDEMLPRLLALGNDIYEDENVWKRK